MIVAAAAKKTERMINIAHYDRTAKADLILKSKNINQIDTLTATVMESDTDAKIVDMKMFDLTLCEISIFISSNNNEPILGDNTKCISVVSESIQIRDQFKEWLQTKVHDAGLGIKVYKDAIKDVLKNKIIQINLFDEFAISADSTSPIYLSDLGLSIYSIKLNIKELTTTINFVAQYDVQIVCNDYVGEQILNEFANWLCEKFLTI